MEDYLIRYAKQYDIQGMADVYVFSWQAAYKDILPQDYLNSLTSQRWKTSYQATLGKEGMPKAVVMIHGDRIIGVSSFNKTRDTDLSEKYGEVISIYLLPEYWHKGLGTILLEWVIEQLKAIGFSNCAIWTLEDNKRAQKTYERFGFARDGGVNELEIGGCIVRDIRYIKEI